MTPGERRYPETIDASRKRRIAAGSGVHVSEINRLLKNYLQMQKMMKSMTKGGGLQNDAAWGHCRARGGRPASGADRHGPAQRSDWPWIAGRSTLHIYVV